MILKNTFLGIAFLLFIPAIGFSQENPSPKTVQASDGTYEKYVLVRWSPPAESKSFKVLRSVQTSPETAREISNTRQKSSWFYDYGVDNGKKYEYQIVAYYEEESASLPSLPDVGYPKPPNPIATDEIELESGLLAVVDPQKFERNDLLNPLVNATRNTDYPFEIASPASNASYTPNLNLEIIIDGQLGKSELSETEIFMLQVYSNNDNDFAEGTPVLQTGISFRATGDGFAFSETFPFPYPQGLYYYVIILENDGDPLHVGQFQVKADE